MRNFTAFGIALALLYFPYVWCRVRHEDYGQYGLDWKIDRRALIFTLTLCAAVLLLLTPVAMHWRGVVLPHKRTARAALNMLASGLAAAIIEETFYRGWLETTLKRKIGIRGAVILTNMLFAASHLILPPHNLWLLATFFPGLIMSFLREKYGNIFPSTLFHFLGNAWSVWFFPL